MPSVHLPNEGASFADQLYLELNPTNPETIRQKKAKKLAMQKLQMDQFVQDKQNEQSLMTGLAVELSQRKQDSALMGSRMDEGSRMNPQGSQMSRTFFGSMGGNSSFHDTHRSIQVLTEASNPTGFLPHAGGYSTASNFFQSGQGPKKAAENMSRMLKEKAREANIDDDVLKEHLPCSLEALDHLGELYLEGTSKLAAELQAA